MGWIREEYLLRDLMWFWFGRKVAESYDGG